MMKWRQFFIPIHSIDSNTVRDLTSAKGPDGITIVDVRQPKEYEVGHIPGARLIPLTDLGDRLNEIDPRKPTVVYCASGGRSRIAAQILSGRGFAEIYDLAGGIKAWNGLAAIGNQNQGLSVFTANLTAKESLLVAYSMEQGLRDFYLSMLPRVAKGKVLDLFKKLADIEIQHQQRIFAEYQRVVDRAITLEAFEADTLPDIMEGGLTTRQYLDLYQPNLDSSVEVIAMAMSIEAQALDLYQRAGQAAQDPEARKMLIDIAAEEQIHLRALGKLMDQL